MVVADTAVVGGNDDSDPSTSSTEREPAGSQGPRRDLTRRLPAVAIVVAVTPILVAGFRAALGRWTPTGDDSYSAIRAWDLFTSNPPLLGTWSSAALYTGHQINHPGPLHFDLLAIPVRLLGHGPGTAIGVALINATAVAVAGWLVLRRLGRAAATVAMGMAALLAWSMGSEMLYSPWSQHAPLLPFTLFLVAVWCAAAGDFVALPIMVVAGNVALQTHLSYAVLVPGLLLFGVAAAAWCVIRQRRADPEAWPALRRRSLQWAAVTVVTQLVVGVQPLAEQLFGPGEGNMTALARSMSADAPTPSLGATIRALGGTVVLPPAWLPPSFGSPSFHINGEGRPTLLAATGLAALIGALGLLGWRAWRRGSQAVAAGAATGLAALVLALITIPRAPIRWGLAPTYFRWMWPLGMVLWLVVAVGVLDELRARAARRQEQADPASSAGARGTASENEANGADGADRATPTLTESTTPTRRPVDRPGWVWAGLAVAVVGCIPALPTIDNGGSSPPWTVEAIQAVDDEVVAAAEEAGSVLVEMSAHMSTGAVGPPVLVALQDAGVPFYVTEEPMVRQLGNDRRYRPGVAAAKLTVIAHRSAEPEPGQRLVAEWSELGPDEEAELARLTGQVEELVAEHGLQLDEEAEEYVRMADRLLRDRIAEAQDDPVEAVADGLVYDLWWGPHPILRGGEPLLDPDVYPPELMDRWFELRNLYDHHVIKVFISPL